ncbi:MAG: hypothetical protein ACOC1O_02810 [bacterium]
MYLAEKLRRERLKRKIKLADKDMQKELKELKELKKELRRDNMDAWGKIVELAGELVKNRNLSKEKAIAEVLTTKQGQKLYRQYREERQEQGRTETMLEKMQ